MIRLTRLQVRVVERVLAAIPLALVVAIAAFVFMRAIPGDPVDIMMGEAAGATADDIELLRRELGLDKPIGVQLWAYLKGLAKGDLGYSIVRSRPVADVIGEAIPATVELALFAMFLALLIGIPVGVASALSHNSLLDRSVSAASFVGISIPPFCLGVVAILVFAMGLGWLPTSGRTAFGCEPTCLTGLYVLDSLLTWDLPALVESLRHLLLPAGTLAVGVAAVVARITRSSMLEVMRADYVLFARAKGVPERQVTVRHGLRNALIPTVTLVGLQLGSLLGGNMIVETIFGWPGLGRVVVDSIFAHDYPMVQASVMVYALTFVVVNLLTDVVYTMLNPKMSI